MEIKTVRGGFAGSKFREESNPMSVSMGEITDASKVHTVGMVVKEEKSSLSEEDLKRLQIRKKLEREVIVLHDKDDINLRKECWYLIDCIWLNKWVEFTGSEDPDVEPPGPVSSRGLLNEKNEPLPNLKAKIDYRGVCPLVYFLFLELYGRDKTPDLCRYKVDIYMLAVPIEQLVDMQRLAKYEANAIVSKLRPQWIKWEREDDDDDEEKDSGCCCGYITKEHIEAFIYWAMHCWNRKSQARKGIKYSQYKPLKPDADALLDSMSVHSILSEDASAVGNAERSASSGQWLRNAFSR